MSAFGLKQTTEATDGAAAKPVRKLPLTSAFLVFAGIMLALCMVVMAQPQMAYALEVEKCTGRPNADSGSDILGATNTRITWEAQAAEDESLVGLTLTVPAGTEFSTDDLRVTMLSGTDLMERTNVEASASVSGDTLSLSFNTPTEPGGYFRVEIYDVFFPREGGDMQLTGTYTLADGTEKAIQDIPVIPVQGITVTEQLSNWLSEQEWVQAWNSNTFLKLFLNPPILVSSLPVVFNGFLMAVAIVAIAFPLAIPFGLILSLMRMARSRILRAIGAFYVDIVRGTPLFLQIYIAFFGLPLAGIQIPSFPLGIVVLAMNSAAYMCEIFRAGIQSIPKGQFEASRSLGMNGAQTMIFVIIPQTVRRVIPTMTSEFILLYKDTSMLAAVGVMEVVMYAKTIVASTGSITPYIVAACFYLVITLPLAKVVGVLENRLAGNDTGSAPKRKKEKKPLASQSLSSQ